LNIYNPLLVGLALSQANYCYDVYALKRLVPGHQ